jgi:hypothetical protein
MRSFRALGLGFIVAIVFGLSVAVTCGETETAHAGPSSCTKQC